MHRSRLFALAALFGLAGMATYYPSLFSEFIYDDVGLIVKVAVEPGKLAQEVRPEFGQGLGEVLAKVQSDRPLTTVSIWLNFVLGGANPFGYKLVNILLHIANSLLLVFFLLEAGAYLGVSRMGLPAAAIGLFFLCHPLHSQAVNTVAERGLLLGLLFGLAGLLIALRSRGWRVIGGAALMALALLSHPTAVMFPAALLVFAVAAGRPRKELKVLAAPLAVAIVFPLVYLYFDLGHDLAVRDLQAWGLHILLQAKAASQYLRQVIYPVGLNAFYPDPTRDFAWVFFMVHLGLLLAALALMRKVPALACGLICFYLFLSPKTLFFVRQHFALDHRMYLPSAFLFLSAYGAVSLLPRRWSGAAAVAVLLFTLPLAALSHGRGRAHQTYLGWLEDSALKYKHLFYVNLDFLIALAHIGDFQRGFAAADQLSAAFPNSPEYVFFRLAFSGDAEDLRRLGIVLADPRFFEMNYRARATMNLMYIAKKRAGAGAREEKLEKIHSVLHPQTGLFLSEAVFFAPMRNEYRSVILELNELYLSRPSGGRIPGEKQRIWRQALGNLEKFSPGSKAELVRKFPAHDALRRAAE